MDMKIIHRTNANSSVGEKEIVEYEFYGKISVTGKSFLQEYDHSKVVKLLGITGTVLKESDKHYEVHDDNGEISGRIDKANVIAFTVARQNNN